MPVAPTMYGGGSGYGGAVDRTPTYSDGSVGVDFGARIGISQDGMPSRIAGVLILAGGTLAALKLLGFRFNVGVSG